MAKSSWGTRYWLMMAGFGGGAFIASTVWIFLWLAPSSGEILRVAAWRMQIASSFHVAVDLQYHGTSTDETHAMNDLQFESEGDYERQAGQAATVQDFSLLLGSASDAPRLSGQYLRQDKTNLRTLHEVPERLGSLNLQPFRDKTLRVDVESALARLPAVPIVGGLKLSDKDRQELTTIAAGLPFLNIVERLKDETLRGSMAHHYKVRPELIYVRDFLKLVEARRLGRELKAKEQNDYDALFANYTAEDGELWIRANDYFVERLRLPLQQVGSKASGTWTLTLNFSNLNVPVKLGRIDQDKIEDATPYIDSLLAAYASHLPLAKAGSAQIGRLGGGGLPVDVIVPSGQADIDSDGLPLILESFYGTDPLNPDSDGDGFDDGYEVTEARSPMGPWGLFDFTQGMFR